MHLRLLHPIGLIVATTLIVVACTSSGATSGGTSGGSTTPTISDAWVRTPMGDVTAGYLTVTGGGEDDALLSASSPAATEVQVHETMAGMSGMTGMQEVDRIDIPAGETVTLEPGGYHLMLMGPDATQFVVGETVDITLTFENAGDVTVQAEVRAG
jgi:copper(I)-binding protein